MVYENLIRLDGKPPTFHATGSAKLFSRGGMTDESDFGQIRKFSRKAERFSGWVRSGDAVNRYKSHLDCHCAEFLSLSSHKVPLVKT